MAEGPGLELTEGGPHEGRIGGGLGGLRREGQERKKDQAWGLRASKYCRLTGAFQNESPRLPPAISSGPSPGGARGLLLHLWR